MTKVRLGILLIALSWLPFAQVFLIIAHHYHYITSSSASDTFRLTIWTLQFLIGFIGIWLVGKLAIQSARADGWRHTPSSLWRMFKDSTHEKRNQ